jgi:hypothetical protein
VPDELPLRLDEPLPLELLPLDEPLFVPLPVAEEPPDRLVPLPLPDEVPEFVPEPVPLLVPLPLVVPLPLELPFAPEREPYSPPSLSRSAELPIELEPVPVPDCVVPLVPVVPVPVALGSVWVDVDVLL